MYYIICNDTKDYWYFIVIIYSSTCFKSLAWSDTPSPHNDPLAPPCCPNPTRWCSLATLEIWPWIFYSRNFAKAWGIFCIANLNVSEVTTSRMVGCDRIIKKTKFKMKKREIRQQNWNIIIIIAVTENEVSMDFTWLVILSVLYYCACSSSSHHSRLVELVVISWEERNRSLTFHQLTSVHLAKCKVEWSLQQVLLGM